EVIGATACGSDGEKLGKVGQLFLDDGSRQPEFVTVRTGLFGHRESFVPVRDAVLEDDRLLVPYTKDQVKDAPHVDVDAGHLDPEAELHLWAHYGLQSDSTVMESLGGAPVAGDTVGGRHAARTDEDADSTTVRSRLRKHLPGSDHETSN
ncbi:MAG TPA: PRC-barrel domain-containing protein, partial [Nocardioides sp.]|nr:PRC-barrel domain-containing protein [Nocardioides sp.]